MSPRVTPSGLLLVEDDDDPTDRGVPVPRDHDPAAEARTAERAACRRCDEHGLRLPDRWWSCDHQPDPTTETARHGARLVREALAAARTSADTPPTAPTPPAPHHAPERPDR